MDDKERGERGTTKRRKVLGNAWVDRSAAHRNSFNGDFLDLISRYAWGDIWQRPHFDDRTRRVLVIGTMVALGNGTNSACTPARRSQKAASRPMTLRKSCSSRQSIAACLRPIMP